MSLPPLSLSLFVPNPLSLYPFVPISFVPISVCPYLLCPYLRLSLYPLSLARFVPISVRPYILCPYLGLSLSPLPLRTYIRGILLCSFQYFFRIHWNVTSQIIDFAMFITFALQMYLYETLESLILQLFIRFPSNIYLC